MVERKSLEFCLANAFTPAQVNFQRQMLAHHNQLRARHCASALQLDDGLNKVAQDYADSLAAQNKFEHSKSGYGENLYMMSSWQSLASLNGNHRPLLSLLLPMVFLGSIPTQSWYDEIKDYDFNKPGFSMAVGHFTQVVWKGSQRLGVGIGFANNGNKAVVVANYDRPGNYLSQFAENVLPGRC